MKFSGNIRALGIVSIVVLLAVIAFSWERITHEHRAFSSGPMYVRGKFGEFGIIGYSGWFECSIKRFSSGTIFLPNSDDLHSSIWTVSGKLDGPMVHYYGHGPFKSIIAARFNYENGNIIDGTFWDRHGRVVRQERWRDEEIVETRSKLPWWDEIQDQTPKDGWYTSLTHTSCSSGPGRTVYIKSQWRVDNGVVVERRDKSPWITPDDGFWKVWGYLLRIDGENGNAFYLKGRQVSDNDLLQLKDGTKINVRISYKSVSYEHEGKRIKFRGPLSWP